MSSELQELGLQTKNTPEYTFSEAHGEDMQPLRKGESATYMEISSGKSGSRQVMYDLKIKWWTRFLGLMIIVNLVFTIICIAIFTQLRSEVMLLKQWKTSVTQFKPEALADRSSYKMMTKPSLVVVNGKNYERGPKEHTGDIGKSGPIGPPGQKGDCGPQGINGTKGEVGNPGEPGLHGIPGGRGPSGIQGPRGERGPSGYNGSNGMTGDIGPLGPKGVKGETGQKGDAGVNGERGSPGSLGMEGIKGDKGESGYPGLNGRNGTNGQQGDKGEHGLTGLAGRDGVNGTAGVPGTNGSKGEPGEAPNITALQAAVRELQRHVPGLNIRLVSSGNYRNRGRVEIRHNGVWGTICDDSWDTNDGAVVCRMLGFSGVSSVSGSAAYGQGSGQIWLDDVNCNGQENLIDDCANTQWGSHNCGHNEDASVNCRS